MMMAPSRYQNENFSEHINYIRSILVRTLSAENVSKSDVLKVKQFGGHYQEKGAKTKAVVDKEIRLRNLKDRQNEERQKKLEEIKAQALAAQRFKEQKEYERRQRLEEMRIKDEQRRLHVEERKKAINDAERDRLESILARNHERQARLETRKRHDRSNIVFAFGSSTPRMLDPGDMSVSFWGHRRATSTQNITSAATGGSLTRRQSERELDVGSKKRATSAGGLERAGESVTSPTTPAGCVSGYLGRRRTDLVPTIPSRDSSFHSSTSRKSLNHSPGRAYSMSRLDQLAKPRKPQLPALTESNMAPKSSVTRSMSHLAHVGTKLSPRKPLNKSDSRSMHHLSPDAPHPPVAPPRVNRATQLRQQKLLMAQQSSSTSEASSRPSSSLSQQSTNSVTSTVKHRISNTPRRPRPASIAVTGVTIEKLNAERGENKPPLPKTRKSLSKTNTLEKIEKGTLKTKPVKSPAEESAPKVVGENKKDVKEVTKKKDIVQKTSEAEAKPSEPVQSREPTLLPQVAENKEAPTLKVTEEPALKPLEPQVVDLQQTPKADSIVQNFIDTEKKAAELVSSLETNQTVEQSGTSVTSVSSVVETKEIKEETKQESSEALSNEMTTSMSKPRITTEEEAKAALAERRRLIREEAERQAELERQRIEAEQKAEFERQLKEEEQARALAEMQRHAEQERLQEAIREAQRREEEERLRKEEEVKQKQLKEEADQKAREEAERQKAELQKKLENEEKEREERRKRVEMIMSRTRGKNNANIASQQNSQDKNENSSENKDQIDENKLNEDNKANENKLNGTKQENGTTETTTKNGKDVGIVDNIIPDESVKNANTVTDTINSDSINSNNSWQAQQYGNLVCNNNS